MDKNLKQAGLRSLAKVAGESSEIALRKEVNKITAALQSETQYDNIETQLELLDTIAYRVYEKTVATIRELLERLKSVELTYEEIDGYPVERLHKFQNSYTLIAKALEVLEHIRYHQPSEILDIFFEYSCHAEENVAKKATHGIEKLSGYDLDIFYGDGKDWEGLGWAPQEKVLEKIASFDEIQKKKYLFSIVIACEQILSPTITGTSSNYKSFTWKTGAVPADSVNDIRKESLKELQNLYLLADTIGQKKAVLNGIEAATRTPHIGEYSDELQTMVIKNTIDVVEFMKTIAVSGDMQLMQKIEHDAYWLLYHMGALDEALRKEILEIRDMLYANNEYQKFRALIGFESIFHDWEKKDKENDNFNNEKKFRESEALKLAQSINIDSYNEWRERILYYASIESNDMATFPYFGKFLENFGKVSPVLALQLLSEASEQLGNFIIAILHGISESERKEDVYVLIERWCGEGKYLYNLARFFEFSSEMNERLFKKILDKSIANNDLHTLNQIISSVSAQYNEDNKHLIQTLVIPALEILTIHKNSGWIFGFWFRKQRGDILSDMKTSEHQVILDNLFWLEKIDYHAEEILCVIAKQSPELVIQFFCNRLSKEKDEEDNGRYDAIPFNFHKLSEPLSQYPAKAIEAVLNTYDGRYSLFIHRGAHLLKNIFTNFSSEFQQNLLKIIQSKKEKDLLFVMSILRNYDGNPIIHNICKELVTILPDGNRLTSELTFILQNTGVVSGEYGLVKAYKQKIDEIQPWLQDVSPKVREFAQNYIASLGERIDFEQKRADEGITLRKHQYGEGE